MAMENTTRSSFQFIKYVVEDASIQINDSNISKRMNLNLKMQTNVREDSPACELSLMAELNDESSNLRIRVRLTGYFEAIDSDVTARDGFICRNAPAILFPYLRAYVSTLTAQSGIPAVIIPTVNLVKEGEDLFNKLSASRR